MVFQGREKEHLEEKVKIDSLSRQLKEQTLEKGALQGELNEAQDLIKDKEQ